MPEEYDLNLQPTATVNVKNRKAAKEAGARAFEEGSNPELIVVSGGKQNKYKPGWTKAFNKSYTARKEADYRYTPDEVYIDKMRSGDTSALPELMHKKSDNTAPYLAAGVLGFPAAMILGAEAIPLITGASALSPGVSAVLTRASNVIKPAVKAVGEFVEPVLNNPFTRFYFSRPVQGAKAIATAAPMAYNWAVNGQKPSGRELTQWGTESALGVALGGNWGEASKAAYEIPEFVNGIGNEIARTSLKGYARIAPNQALNWARRGTISPLKSEVDTYLNSVSPRDQKWFNKNFSAEKLQDLKQANIDNFNMRLRIAAPKEVNEYFNQNPEAFNKLANSYTERFNFQLEPMTRYEKWSDPLVLGVTNKSNGPAYSYFQGEQLTNPKISIRGNLFTNSANNTAMHEYHHAADNIAQKMQRIDFDHDLQFFPNNVNSPVYYYNPNANFSVLPYKSNTNSTSNLFNKLNGVDSNYSYAYMGKDYTNSPGEVRARMSGYAYTHSTPENKLYSKPFAEWDEKNKRGFIISDRLYDPFNFPMNYRKFDTQVKALEEYPGIFNRQGGKLIKRK